jgi:ADP-ribose pyrophosphatase YjhB (NUDIX family)
MQKWYGSAGVCFNEKKEILMVLQGKPDEEKVWTVPSGGLEKKESFEECCVREFREETGYEVEVVTPLKVKKGTTYGIDVEVHYFEVRVVGGTPQIQDPDNLIHEIAWKNAKDLTDVKLSFPEDRHYLLELMESMNFSKS